MAEAESAPSAPNQRLVAELKVSGHLMNLEPGLFCILQTPGKNIDAANGLPGVRISLPPGPINRGDLVSIKTFREDGWLYGTGDAALVRVIGGSAQVLVTVYQGANGREAAPNLQVLRLLEADAVHAQPDVLRLLGRPQGTPQMAPVAAPAQLAKAGTAAPAGEPVVMDMVAHIQSMGDVGGKLGEWLGQRGSRAWIEGFAIAPTKYVTAADIEYQAVLGRGWSSPWVEGGEFCGSRGMALPVLGIRLRLKGRATEKFDCYYSATFVDGTAVGPVPAGEACEAESLAAIEAFQVVIHPIGQPPAIEADALAAAGKAAEPKKGALPKPAPKKGVKESVAPPAPAPAPRGKPTAPAKRR